MNKPSITAKKIESTFAATLAREGFRDLEVVLRGMRDEKTLWTICGPMESVVPASEWLVGSGLLELEDAPTYDAECEEGYAYMHSI